MSARSRNALFRLFLLHRRYNKKRALARPPVAEKRFSSLSRHSPRGFSPDTSTHTHTYIRSIYYRYAVRESSARSVLTPKTTLARRERRRVQSSLRMSLQCLILRFHSRARAFRILGRAIRAPAREEACVCPSWASHCSLRRSPMRAAGRCYTGKSFRIAADFFVADFFALPSQAWRIYANGIRARSWTDLSFDG